MTTFDQALKVVLQHEGGFSDDHDDPGGVTKYGISLNYLQRRGLSGDVDHNGHVDREDIIAMTKEQAAVLYLTDFWSPMGCDKMTSKRVALMAFDSAVNVGVGTASKMLQRSCGASVDGIVGSATLYLVNSTPENILAEKFAAYWADYYKIIITRNPTLRKYLNGWTNRINDSLTTPI